MTPNNDRRAAEVIGMRDNGTYDLMDIYAVYRKTDKGVFMTYRCPICGNVHSHGRIATPIHESHCPDGPQWSRLNCRDDIKDTLKEMHHGKCMFCLHMTDDFFKAGDLNESAKKELITVEEGRKCTWLKR